MVSLTLFPIYTNPTKMHVLNKNCRGINIFTFKEMHLSIPQTHTPETGRTRRVFLPLYLSKVYDLKIDARNVAKIFYGCTAKVKYLPT